MSKTVRAHVIISGRVQGVCFRMETRRMADRIGVRGWVRNTIEGTVEAVFEGDEEKVLRILEWCRQGPPHADVHHVEIEWEPYAGELNSFEIRYDVF